MGPGTSRSRASEADAGDAQGNHRSRRPPGRLPWTTFRQGTIALLVVWFLGFVWACSNLIFQLDIPLKPVEPEFSGMSFVGNVYTQAPELVFAGPAPHAHFHPRGLACNAEWGPQFLLLERYSAHLLRLEGQGNIDGDSWGAATDTALAPVSKDCFSHASSFQAEGVHSAAIECGDQDQKANCRAVFLSAKGSRVLRCGLASGLQREKKASAANATKLHGGPWRSLALGSSRGPAWGLRDTTLIQLRRRGRTEDLVPEAEISHAVNASQLHALGSAAVLGLQAQRLHAWFADGKSKLSWHLPPGRWKGVCATRRSLYLLNVVSKPNKSEVQIWRTGLPPELVKAAAE